MLAKLQAHEAPHGKCNGTASRTYFRILRLAQKLFEKKPPALFYKDVSDALHARERTIQEVSIMLRQRYYTDRL